MEDEAGDRQFFTACGKATRLPSRLTPEISPCEQRPRFAPKLQKTPFLLSGDTSGRDRDWSGNGICTE